jgi:hypothetical protein
MRAHQNDGPPVKDLAHRVLAEYAELTGSDAGLSVRRALKLADQEAARRRRPELLESADFMVEVVGRELERRGVGSFDWRGWSRRDTLGDLPHEQDQADLEAERVRREAVRARRDAERERVAADVLARLPNGGEVRVTAGRLADDALQRARERGRPELAGDPAFVTGVAKGYFSGHLGRHVLDG